MGPHPSVAASDPSPALVVRDALSAEVELVVAYFHDADAAFLRGMGVDVDKLPPRDEWIATIRADMEKPPRQRALHYLIWLIDGVPGGHSNVNKITYGRDAFMHLHVWDPQNRRRGLGTRLVRASARRYCTLFELTDLFCEPYAHNPAPNRALEKAGFEFVMTHEPPPGYINFPQELNRWRFGCR